MQPQHIEIPHEYLCPILQTLMQDPVLTEDGFTFQRDAIEQWFSTRKKTNPLTNKILTSIKLVPNRSLKILITEFLQQLPSVQRDQQESTRLQNLVGKLKDTWKQTTGNANKKLLVFKEQLTLKKNFYAENKHNIEGVLFGEDEYGKYYGEKNGPAINGIGKFVACDGKGWYEGEWTDGNIWGYGVYGYGDGSWYEGMWENGKKKGMGIMHYNDGAVYEGEWDNNVREGQGVIHFNDGATYSGDWKNNQRSGMGIMRYNDGAQYEGEWLHDGKHGKGVMAYNDGDKYSGHWENDMRCGRGCYKQANTSYSGQWKNNVKHGKGIQYLNNGHMLAQQWNNGTQLQ